MTPLEASQMIVPSGRWAGKTINRCAMSESGLRWLVFVASGKVAFDAAFVAAVKAFLSDESLKDAIAKL